MRSKKMKFAVKVHNKYLSEAVQKLAFDNGYSWASGVDVSKDLDMPIIEFNYYGNKTITGAFLTSMDLTLDALTDWQKIEEAMKPKVPRVIWVNEKDGLCLSEKCYTDEQQAKRHKDVFDYAYIRTVKFQEVIE